MHGQHIWNINMAQDSSIHLGIKGALGFPHHSLFTLGYLQFQFLIWSSTIEFDRMGDNDCLNSYTLFQNYLRGAKEVQMEKEEKDVKEYV